jgi:molecular chaperone GrpE
LEQRLAAKEEEIAQIQDRMLRLAAEMENTRKRLEREKADGIAFANECLIRELLPVIDNLERAVSHGAGEDDASTLIEGVRMTLKGFLDALAKFGCSPFESVGCPFDPKVHEAVAQQDAPGQPPGVVILELHKGYMLHERLLRPALVIVSRAAGGDSG